MLKLHCMCDAVVSYTCTASSDDDADAVMSHGLVVAMRLAKFFVYACEIVASAPASELTLTVLKRWRAAHSFEGPMTGMELQKSQPVSAISMASVWIGCS